jgi:hypothetical protein
MEMHQKAKKAEVFRRSLSAHEAALLQNVFQINALTRGRAHMAGNCLHSIFFLQGKL